MTARLLCGKREGVIPACASRATVTITDAHGVEHRCTKHGRQWIATSCRYAVPITVTAVDPGHASAAVLKLLTPTPKENIMLKVWGFTTTPRREWEAAAPELGRQCRVIVAAPNGRQAAAVFGLTLGELRGIAGITGNAREIEVATAKPGAVFCAAEGGREAERIWHEVAP